MLARKLPPEVGVWVLIAVEGEADLGRSSQHLAIFTIFQQNPKTTHF